MKYISIKNYKFQNNLSGIIAHTESLPVKNKRQFYASIVIKAGSLSDHSNPGIAHFTEHMLLTLDQVPEFNKCNLNFQLAGITGFDRTKYILRSTDSYIEQGITLLRNVAFGKYLNQLFLERVRENVIREYQYKILNNEVKMISYIIEGTNLLGHSPIGNLEYIRNFSYQKVVSFFKENYISNQTCICILSDLNSDRVAEKICSSFHTSVVDKSNILPDTYKNEIKKKDNLNIYEGYKINIQKIPTMPSNEMHFYIKSCINNYSVEEFVLESIVSTLGTECLKVSFKDIKDIKCGINQFSKSYRYIHFTVTFTCKHEIKKESGNILKKFIYKWINMCKNKNLLIEIKSEYKKKITSTYQNPFDTLKEMEDTFIYKHCCYFTIREINEVIDQINIFNVADFLKNSILNGNDFYIFVGEINYEVKK